jgi:dsDNA-specific endonuclease/ATPase MutS2
MPETHSQGSEDPVRIPITGELDLHTFPPSELGPLLDAYLEECRGRGLLAVRIIHGKGTGALRERVHVYLRKSPIVRSYRLGNEQCGSWGATIAELQPR